MPGPQQKSHNPFKGNRGKAEGGMPGPYRQGEGNL